MATKQYIFAPGVFVNETGTRQEILAPGVYLNETTTTTAATANLFFAELPLVPRPRRLDAALAGDSGTQSPFFAWRNSGWEIASPQPPRRRSEPAGALMRGDDGSQAGKINFLPTGFEAVPHQPNHPRPERAGAWMFGDGGIENTKPAVIVTSGWGFDPQPWQPPRPLFRVGSIARGDDGTAFTVINFLPAGFESLLHQPSHPRPERSAAIALGDIGHYAQIAPVVVPGWAFDAQPGQPPRQIYRAATLPWGDDGTQSPFILFRPTGFEVSPFQPPHPRFEQRAAGFLRGDEGNQDILRSWFNAGWEVAPYQPQHVAYAKAGAIMFGDTGTESVYVFIAPAVGTATWRTLMGVGI